ncbi:MAG TPA: hypothetical protein VI461_11535 [Chitinophagaceae bacterium]|nr:hypothetical protein [Chitinophagaceae bacterium]
MADTELQQLAKTDRNPVQETRYQELLRQQQGQQQQAQQQIQAMYDPIANAQKLQQFQVQQNQPAITSLQQSIPETQQKFQTTRSQIEGQVQPLKQRYSNLLDELKRRETVDTQSAQLATAQEYGKRGIPLSSGAYSQALSQKTTPISQFYTGQIKDTSLAQEEGLMGIQNLLGNLAGQETEATRGIQNAIAQLQSGDPASAIQGALSIINMQQQQSQFQAQQGLQQQQLGLQERELAARLQPQPQQKEQFATIGEGSTLFDLLAGRPLYTAPKTYKPTSGGGGGDDPLGLF